MHGIRIVEYGTNGAPIALLPSGLDTLAPSVPDVGIDEALIGEPYLVGLAADEQVVFRIRAGSDGALFRLVGAELTLPVEGRPAGPCTLVCNLRAIDARGNRTSFVHRVLVLGRGEEPTSTSGALDFSDPANSAFIR